MDNNQLPQPVSGSSTSKKHFNDKFLVGLVAGIGISILCVGIVVLIYTLLQNNTSNNIENNSNTSNTTTTPVNKTTTPVLTTSVATSTPANTTKPVATTALSQNYNLTINGSDTAPNYGVSGFDKSTLNIKKGDTVTLTNKSSYDLGDNSTGGYVSADSPTKDSHLPTIKNNETYKITFNESGKKYIRYWQGVQDTYLDKFDVVVNVQ